MFSGAQISLYPMTDDFVGVITDALSALDQYRDRLRIETDDISTLIVGTPTWCSRPCAICLPPLPQADNTACCTRRSLVAALESRRSDLPNARVYRPLAPLDERKAKAKQSVADAPVIGQQAAAQFSLYTLGIDGHMDEIYGCIDFVKTSGVFEKSKNFCTKLRGDTGAVFATVHEALVRFGPPAGHVTIDLTVSANSPSAR